MFLCLAVSASSPHRILPTRAPSYEFRNPHSSAPSSPSIRQDYDTARTSASQVSTNPIRRVLRQQNIPYCCPLNRDTVNLPRQACVESRNEIQFLFRRPRRSQIAGLEHSMLRALVLCIVLLPTSVSASDKLLGVWQSAEEDIRLDILDGFKPNRGAVLSIENGSTTKVGSWETKDLDTELKIGWSSDTVRFRGADSFEWRNKVYNRSDDIVENNVILLKKDEPAFVDRITKHGWLTSTEGERAIFKSTFSIDSGVAELYTETGELKGLGPWGISSGVLKIHDKVIVEARVSDNYLIGQDHRDNFVVFLATQDVEPQRRIELAKTREDFLSKLLTDTWRKTRYGTNYYYKFRNVEGPLKGRVLKLEEDKFEGSSVWEYSPSTGAIKVGYTDYVGGLVVGNTLALLKEDGEQEFYQQTPDGPGRVFSMSDVTAHRVNETQMEELKSILDGQFQLRSYLYSFEFKEDGRTGYVHEWRSVPFAIAGQQLSNRLLSKTELIYSLEEFLIFDDNFSLKRDATASRLRPKTDAEAAEDQEAMEHKLKTLGETSLLLLVTDVNGECPRIRAALPFNGGYRRNSSGRTVTTA